MVRLRVSGTRRAAVLVTSLLALQASACDRRASTMPLVPPLGPGPVVELAVPGARAVSPVMASHPPLVAVAFATTDTRGAGVYLAVSGDNGASFTDPEPVSREEGVDAALADLQLDIAGAAVAPAQSTASVRVSWRTRAGHAFSRSVRPWTGRDPAPPSAAPDLHPAPALTCEPSGELRAAVRSDVDAVSVNHGLAEQQCEAGDAASAADLRGWSHAVWVGHDGAARRLFYAGSSDGQWFGGAHALETGSAPSHVALAVDPNQTVVAVWDEAAEGGRHVRLQQVIPAHHGPATLLPAIRLSVSRGGHPAVVAVDGGVAAAWVDESSGRLTLRRVGLDALCAVEPPSATQVVDAR